MMKNFYRIKNKDIDQLGYLEDHGIELIEREDQYSLVRMTDESASALIAAEIAVVRC